MVTKSKPLVRSYSAWLGILIVLTSVVEYLMADTSPLQEYPEVMLGLGIVSGVLVLVVRRFTKCPISGVFRR